MLWTLEGAGLLAAALLTQRLVVGAVVYSSWVLVVPRVAVPRDLGDAKRMRETLVRLTAVAGFASGLLWGCGGNGGTTGGTCGKVQPCGGNIVGTWTLDAACTSNAPVPGKVCATATAVSSNYQVSGTATFGADMTYSITEVVSGTIDVQVPASCLMSNGATVTCADFVTSLEQQNPGESVSCTASGGVCVCTFALSSRTVSENGTYSTAGTVFTETPAGQTPKSVNYCVQGNTVHVISVDRTTTTSTRQPAIVGDIVGVRQ